ncbi:MAG: hypothetical protein QN145_09140 [Armatimonadota bacterium]|nr:hypothetical protein [Armatimonadota bacterium]MDR7595962.1 hypothetical protein [Armatimonadota bacterium]MDR7617206.1 hypothetical protein [Armatimonadota bacterium]
MARLEGSYEQLDKRLGDLGADLQALRAEFRTEIQAVRAELQNLRAEFRSDLQAVRAEMGRLFYWLMGTFLTVLVGIGGTIVTVLLRTR